MYRADYKDGGYHTISSYNSDVEEEATKYNDWTEKSKCKNCRKCKKHYSLTPNIQLRMPPKARMKCLLKQWIVKWRGSFPIDRVSMRTISRCLDASLVLGDRVGDDVLLRVSLFDISLCRIVNKRNFLNVDEHRHRFTKNKNEAALFDEYVVSHLLKEVLFVVGRVESCQIAYVTSQSNAHQHATASSNRGAEYVGGRTRRYCHVFCTDSQAEVKNIEECLSEAFQQACSSSKSAFDDETVKFRKPNMDERMRPRSHRHKTESLDADLIKFRDHCASSGSRSSASVDGHNENNAFISPRPSPCTMNKPTTVFKEFGVRFRAENCAITMRPSSDTADLRKARKLCDSARSLAATPPVSEDEAIGIKSTNLISPNTRGREFQTPYLSKNADIKTPTTVAKQKFLSRSRRHVNSGCSLLLQRIVGSATSLLASSSRVHDEKSNKEKNSAFRSSQRHRIAPRALFSDAQLGSPNKRMKEETSEIRFRDLEFKQSNAPTSSSSQHQSESQEENGCLKSQMEEFATPKSSLFSTASKRCRKRRPVSAIFTRKNVLQRLSSAATFQRSSSNNPSLTTRSNMELAKDYANLCPKRAAEDDANNSDFSVKELEKLLKPEPNQLKFNEKINEWIFPISDQFLAYLQNLAYFCDKNVERREIMRRLGGMPAGTFVLRVSASCSDSLALSVRVPSCQPRSSQFTGIDFVEEENKGLEEADNDGQTVIDDEHESNKAKKGQEIAHYLILHGKNGFCIKGSKQYFPSLAQLVTHHTVMREQLPCRLAFSDHSVWRRQKAQ